ncbi:MAG: Rieske 2Fe-2S domain-containing protein [Anaerolineae bacterium]
MALVHNTRAGTGHVPRRGFLKALAAVVAGVWYGLNLSGCSKQGDTAPRPPAGDGATLQPAAADVVTLSLQDPKNQVLTAIGGTRVLEANVLDSNGLLVYRVSATQAVAYSRRCPHLGCKIGGFENGVATCPCHASEFDVRGQVVRGPAQQGLKAYPVTVTETELRISRGD